MPEHWILQIFSDGAMFCLYLASFILIIIYMLKTKDGLAFGMLVPMSFMLLNYTLLAFDVEPFESNMRIRLALFRPSSFLFMIAFTLFVLRDYTNRLIYFIGKKWPTLRRFLPM